jgi:hypothetical protein
MSKRISWLTFSANSASASGGPTGRIGDSLVEAKCSLPSGAGGTESCGVSILGFNAASTRFYDEVGCRYHGGSSAT